MLVLLFICLSGLFQSTTGIIYWTAYVEISYQNSSTNQTVSRLCECGLYGSSSILKNEVGVVILPESDPLGCQDTYPRRNNTEGWIALVKRGNCSFSDKISVARDRGASAVVIYNLDGTGNSPNAMVHTDAKGIVAIMIGNLMGIEIVNLVQSGVDVTMLIQVGNANGPWIDTYWLYFLSIAFFIVTGASIFYFLFVSAHRLHGLRAMRRANKRLKNEAKKAIGRLEVRKLKQGDEETKTDSHTCAVCIESYRPGDTVTVLTCGHLFHKACIEPWLLDKRTCPMCKADILKSLGVEVPEDKEPNHGSSAPPPDVTIVTVSRGMDEALYDVPLNDDPALNPDLHTQAWQPRHYDNMAFEGDTRPHENMATRG